MEDKKIDLLFQEKLKNLEATPDKKVWNRIASQLKKKKRRVLPIWWYSGGVAATLVLGFLLFPFGKDSETNKQPIIIASPESNPKKDDALKKENDPLLKKIDEKTLWVEGQKRTKKLIPKKNENKKSKNQLLIANETKKEDEVLLPKITTDTILLTDNIINKVLDTLKNKTIIAQENILENAEIKNSAISNETIVFKENSDASLNPKSETNKNSLPLVNAPNKEEKKNLKKRWSISPVVAVLSSNSFSKTSPIDASLSNSTSGNNSYSYGIQVGYKMNNKWSIQSGVHIQEVSFSNPQIAIVSASSNNTSIAFNSGNRFKLQDASVLNSDAEALPLTAITIDGNLNQKYGYVEIPIEVKYNLLEGKHLKTEIIAGFSSLFLNKNSINVSSNSFSQSGEATNLNNFNFSGNFGLDFKYTLTKNWSLNLNPMLKTQLRTFSENSNGFKPYFIGVYTGINYQF